MRTLNLILGTTAIIPVIAQNAISTPNPNIVIIITDQQYVGKMSYMGDVNINTPAMDRLARSGYAFTDTYCAFPLSIPSRFSMFTGHYPSSVNLRANPKKRVETHFDMDKISALAPLTLGNLFSDAGYDTYYGGKAHLISSLGSEDPKHYGFRYIYSTQRREKLGQAAAEFLASKRLCDKPFLMVVSYINPHDICEYDDYVNFDNLTERTLRLKAEGLKRVGQYVTRASEQYTETEFYDNICPKLPENHARTQGEPVALPGKVAGYTERQWRMHRWVYDRLTEEVDSDIAPVLEALEKGGFLKNTIIVFTSDHGDMDGAHQREHKTIPYRECQNVPLVFCGPGISVGIRDSITTVNNGIDLLPTLCDLAGIAIPKDCPGLSLKGVLTGTEKVLNRKYIFCEGPNWFQVVKQGRYKYTVMETSNNPDMLIDLQTDPGEMINLSGNANYATVKTELIEVLRKNLAERGLRLSSAGMSDK